jgi:hypothetical protein
MPHCGEVIRFYPESILPSVEVLLFGEFEATECAINHLFLQSLHSGNNPAAFNQTIYL